MKILHTGDLHIGHVLYNWDRLDEHRAMFDTFARIVGREQPDAMVISGDVFHTSQPSASAQTLLNEGIMQLCEAAPAMTVVITAGNHDSASRHDVFALPWLRHDVHFIGNLRDDRREHIITVPGKGYIVAMPYVHQRSLPEGIYRELTAMAMERNDRELPVVLMAHTTMLGCDMTGHDDSNPENTLVGGIDAIDVAEMGTDWDYLALGHIHKPQWVHGTDHKARYAGTPLPVSFDETFEHSVSIVEIERHGAAPVVRLEPIPSPRTLLNLPGSGFAPWNTVKELLEGLPKEDTSYLRLNVEVEDFEPAEARDFVRRAVADKNCRYCLLNARRRDGDNNETEHRGMTMGEFLEMPPLEVARRFAAEKKISFDNDMVEMFNIALERVMEEDRK